jgi:hypothetical protein
MISSASEQRICDQERKMNAEAAETNGSWFAQLVNVGKDLVALLRDTALFILAMLLVIYPESVNRILVKAGFQEGSLAGFTWKSNLLDSNSSLEEAQATLSTLRAENKKLLDALAEANGKLVDPALQARVADLTKQNVALMTSTAKVQDSVSATLKSNAPLVQTALATSPSERAVNKADLSVGLQTLGLSDDERSKINGQLHDEGYGLDDLSGSYATAQRPLWFAQRSTVFYYAPSAIGPARQLAATMKRLTGVEFAVQRGSGLGVDPDRKAATLFVHYVHTP